MIAQLLRLFALRPFLTLALFGIPLFALVAIGSVTGGEGADSGVVEVHGVTKSLTAGNVVGGAGKHIGASEASGLVTECAHTVIDSIVLPVARGVWLVRRLTRGPAT